MYCIPSSVSVGFIRLSSAVDLFSLECVTRAVGPYGLLCYEILVHYVVWSRLSSTTILQLNLLFTFPHLLTLLPSYSLVAANACLHCVKIFNLLHVRNALLCLGYRTVRKSFKLRVNGLEALGTSRLRRPKLINFTF